MLYGVGDIVRDKHKGRYGFIIEVLHSSAFKVFWFLDKKEDWIIRPERITKVSSE